MILRTPRSTLTDTLFPDTTLFRSQMPAQMHAPTSHPSPACFCRNARLDAHRLPDIGSRSEEHTSELQSLMRISYAVFCLKKNIKLTQHNVIRTLVSMQISISNLHTQNINRSCRSRHLANNHI